MTTVRFTRDDLAMFSEASHDHSALHMSDDYASQTSYGKPPVFGVLGAFAALRALPDRPGRRLSSVRLTYRVPFFMEVDYLLETGESSPDRAAVVLKGERKALMSASFAWQDRTDPDRENAIAGTSIVRRQAQWRPEELRAGVQVSGRYAASPAPLRSLLECWQLTEKGVSIPQITALLWSSYLTGMVLPGLRGTSAQLQMSYGRDGLPAESPFDFEAAVLDFDERFSMLHTSAKLTGEQGVFAVAEVWSLVRADSSPAPE